MCVKPSLWDDVSSIEKAGYLECKQTLQSGGKRAVVRSWKQYYTVLCGQLMCFFKDEHQFEARNALRAPIYILGAVCRTAPDYHKRKNVFRLKWDILKNWWQKLVRFYIDYKLTFLQPIWWLRIFVFCRPWTWNTRLVWQNRLSRVVAAVHATETVCNRR